MKEKIYTITNEEISYYNLKLELSMSKLQVFDHTKFTVSSPPHLCGSKDLHGCAFLYRSHACICVWMNRPGSVNTSLKANQSLTEEPHPGLFSLLLPSTEAPQQAIQWSSEPSSAWLLSKIRKMLIFTGVWRLLKDYHLHWQHWCNWYSNSLSVVSSA